MKKYINWKYGSDINFGIILFFVSLVLKFTNAIDWQTFIWITSPIWLYFFSMFVLVLFVGLKELMKKNK